MAKIDEVARAAGVSISTVSYALSGKRPVSPATKARIEAVIRELDYRPNAGARMLASSRSQIFALAEPLRDDTHGPTHMAFVLAATVAARRADYDILLLTDEDATAGMRRVTQSGLVDAILAMDVAPDDARVAIARDIDMPVVFVGVPDDHAGLICVDLDFAGAAAEAVDRLADLGHENIALVGQTEHDYRVSNFRPRALAGFRERAAERGVTAAFRTTGETQPDGIVASVDALLDAGATALVLHTSLEITLAVLRTLTARGLAVPADVSVIALANTFDAQALPTPLDELPLVPSASCDLAVDLALRALEPNAPEPRLHLISPVYTGHASTAPPPRR